MEKPEISDEFTIEDIHKIREYNYEMTKDMSFEERKAYYKKGSEAVQKRIDEIRKSKKSDKSEPSDESEFRQC